MTQDNDQKPNEVYYGMGDGKKIVTLHSIVGNAGK